MKKIHPGLAAALIALGAAGVWYVTGRHAMQDQTAENAPENPGTQGGTTANPSPFGSLPAGKPTVLPGEAAPSDTDFQVDAKGQLVMNHRTLFALDALVADQGHEPDESFLKRTQADLHAKLKEPAASQACALLEHYLAMRKAQATLTPGTAPVLQDGNAQLGAIVQAQQAQALHRQFLGEQAAQALYGDEEAYTRYQLARQQIMQMNGLSDEDKAKQLEALRQQLPPSVQDAVRARGE
jgi:lipase chaperone LimK